jgi:hypothetical protein
VALALPGSVPSSRSPRREPADVENADDAVAAEDQVRRLDVAVDDVLLVGAPDRGPPA